jgi:hypothetical protein
LAFDGFSDALYSASGSVAASVLINSKGLYYGRAKNIQRGVRAAGKLHVQG